MIGNFRELALTRELNAKDPDLAFYYMGFYIHSCPKMRYKGHYTPSYLLCPAAYSWHPIEKCRELLDKEKYSEFDAQNAQRAIHDDDLKAVGSLRLIEIYSAIFSLFPGSRSSP